MATIDEKSESRAEQKSALKAARLSIRLRSDLKELIEDAAATLGQSISDFAVSTLVREARDVLQQDRITKLSKRDWELFIKLINDTGAEPNEKLKGAARRYRERTDIERADMEG